VTAEDRATQVAGPAFDASVWELWPYLTAGASIHVISDRTRNSPAGLIECLAAEGVTLSFLPTALADLVLEEAWPEGVRLRALLTGGDKLHRAPRRGLPFRLVNHYGPTENTVVATFATVEPGGAGVPPIGRPISNVRVYVLDAAHESRPVGVPGELCIAGDSLQAGRNLPELTAARFIPDPFSEVVGSDSIGRGSGAVSTDGPEFRRLDAQVAGFGGTGRGGKQLAQLRRCERACGGARGSSRGATGRVRGRALLMDLGAGRRGVVERGQVGRWRHLRRDVCAGVAADPSFNIVGWNSSYTGEPLTAAEMRSRPGDRVADLRPEAAASVGDRVRDRLLLFAWRRIADGIVRLTFRRPP
jgi:hypothetical protein